MPFFDGQVGRVHYRSWSPPRAPVAHVIFLHGLGEHVGLYEPTAAALTGAGIALHALDHAGHGLSDGERVLISDVDELVADARSLWEIARGEYPDLPVVIAGHSLGSSLAVLLAATLAAERVPVAGLVLAGSSLLPGPFIGELLASGVDPLTLRVDPGELVRDPTYAQRVRDDPLVWAGGIRPETLRALDAGQRATGGVLTAGSLDLPTLFLHGEEDPLAPGDGARAAAALFPAARLVTFPADRHNILNETDRDAILAQFTDFVITTARPTPEPQPADRQPADRQPAGQGDRAR